MSTTIQRKEVPIKCRFFNRLNEMFGGASVQNYCRATNVCVPLSLTSALTRCVQDVLRADAQVVRGTRFESAGRAGSRSSRIGGRTQLRGGWRHVVPSEYLEVVITKR
jgi:hypothetical protein